MAIRCYHVTTEQGAVYGAAATAKRDAMAMVQDRLSELIEDDGRPCDDRPKSVTDTGPWPGAKYGTTLQYIGPRD